MLEKIKKLISSAQLQTVNAGLQLLDALQDQKLYENLLDGWGFKKTAFDHPNRPFADFVAWHLWMHSPQRITSLPIGETLEFNHPNIEHLPQKGWQRLAHLSKLKLPKGIPFRHYPAEMMVMRKLQHLEWQGSTAHPPTELLQRLTTIGVSHDNHSVTYSAKKQQLMIYKREQSWRLSQVYAVTLHFPVHKKQSFFVCRDSQQGKTFILEKQNDTDSTTILLSQAPSWLQNPPPFGSIISFRIDQWQNHFMAGLLPKEQVFQQWHQSSNSPPLKWQSKTLCEFPDSPWFSLGSVGQIRTKGGLLESNPVAVTPLQKSTRLQFRVRLENHIHSLLRLPKLNFQNMMYLETQQNYHYEDEDITEKIGNWLFIYSVNINQQKAYIYTRLESPISSPDQRDPVILLRDALLEQIAYSPTEETLDTLLLRALSSLCAEIHLLEDKVTRDYQKFGIQLWKAN